MNDDGRLTDKGHWDQAWRSSVRPRLPSSLNVDTANIFSLLRPHVRPGHRYIEIGCAPGKLLAWVAAELKAETSGLDYSDTGIANCRSLFRSLGLSIELIQGDFFDSSLRSSSYDVVTSFGFIEHFDDPAPVVAKHVELLKPGGVALITVPNYGSVYGRLQKYFDPDNLALHNTRIMSPTALTDLVYPDPDLSVKAYAHGVASPWLVTLNNKWPRRLASAAQWSLNGLGLLQFFDIDALAPMLVLEVRRSLS